MIKTYSLKKDGQKYITPNFQVKEFACSDGSDTVFVDDVLVNILQGIRVHFGKAVHINSGYRTDAKNKATKDAGEFSQHLYGKAADIRIDGVAPKTLYDYCGQLLLTGGLGLYSWGVHIDVRDEKSRF